MTDAVTLHAAVRGRLAVRPLLLLLDVDGTLSAIAPSPEAAVVPAETRAALAALAATPGVHVALVSGRAARDAMRLVGVPGLWAIGNHGFERLAPDGTLATDDALTPWRERIAAARADAAALVRAHEGARLEDKVWTLSIHYRAAHPTAEAPMRAGLERVAGEHGLALTAGRKVFELRPRVAVDKGTASLALLERLAPGRPLGVLYAGDDRTDEDAFRALRKARPEAVTIRVASSPDEAPVATAAEFRLPDVDAVGAFLRLLAG